MKLDTDKCKAGENFECIQESKLTKSHAQHMRIGQSYSLYKSFIHVWLIKRIQGDFKIDEVFGKL